MEKKPTLTIDKGLLLASGSKARASLLHNAGIAFLQKRMPDQVEEDAKKAFADRDLPAQKLSSFLARQKAEYATHAFPQHTVLCADQVLLLEDRPLHKAKSLEQAKEILQQLRGKTHHLSSSVCLMEKEKCLMEETYVAKMHMRSFSDAFLEDYVDICAKDLLSCAGCYHLEGLGLQLFSHIEGDYFTILGLPMFPLLETLRAHGLAAT